MARHRYAALTVLLLATSTTGNAVQPPVQFTRQDVLSHAGARAIVTGDFDRDGWIDIAHANAGRNSVTVLLNQGNGATNFLRSYDVPVGSGPFDLAAGDFNQDGVLDLAVTHGSASTISILRGQVAGGFVRTELAVPSGPRGITATDFNKDGRLDLIVTGWDANAVQVLLGNGSGGFVNGASVSSIASHPQGVAASDFNHDGHLDLAVAHESGNGLVVLTGRFGAIVQTRAIPGMANLNVLTVGDFNRDGWSDVAAASSSGNRVGVYLGGASGPRFHRAYATGAAPRGITARDIDYDGLLDLITANRDGDSISLLVGDSAAPGTFAPAEPFVAGPGSRAVAAEDFDRDGRIDLATGNQDAATASVLWNDTAFDRAAFSFSRLSFGPPSNEIGGSSAIPADFNEDGKLDVVVKPAFTLGPVVQVLLTDGPVVTLRFQQYSGGYLVDDFNRDGHMDVILVEAGQPMILWPYLGNGRGAFTRAPETILATTNFGIVAAGDLNADAAPDLVLVSHDPGLGTYFLQVLIGRGDGRFALGSRINTPDYTSGVSIVDETRDGKMDVVAFVRGTLTVYRGDGTGHLTFDSAATFSNGVLQVLVLADLNHDGFLDAVAGEQSRVSVSLGGAAGFAAPAVIELDGFSNWSSVAVADINLDGTPDIIGGAGFILRGRGDGTFEPRERFDWDAPYLHVVDFTRDGLPDIVIPGADAAFHVIVNRRNSINHAPAVDAGPDQTLGYADQFVGDLGPSITAVGTDPDLHELTYEWRDERGTIVEMGRSLTIRGFTHGTYTFVVTVRDGRGGTATDSIRVTIVPSTEVVVWSASGFYGGTFSQVADSTAASGERGYDRNLGRPKATTPTPFSGNRVILGFVADPTQTYKLWLRLKADGNHWSNDSVWVQFSGSADLQGNPVYRVGTTSGLAVNLEECLDCGVSGWGWADDGWGAPNLNGVTLRFPAGGHQSIVIQTREDGVSFDQLVLSSRDYFTTRPGPAKNDATILPFTFWQEQ